MRAPLSFLSSLSLVLALGATACEPNVRGPTPGRVGFRGTSSPRALPQLSSADTPPPPLSGGSLLVLDDRAVVADPDRDVVHLVDVSRGISRRLLASAELDPGDEPGRVVADDRGHYFVALRGGGAVAELDASLALVARHSVCASPRGVATRGSTLYVACLEGELVHLDTATGEVLRRQRLGRDLRDVVVTEEHLYVSHFRSAAVTVMKLDGSKRFLVEPEAQRGTAAVAYRMIARGRRAYVLHQIAQAERPVSVDPEAGAYGGFACEPGLVQAAITILDGGTWITTEPVGGLVLPVDIAADPTGDTLAIAAAGSRTDDPQPGTPFPDVRAPAVAMTSVWAVESGSTGSLACSGGLLLDRGRRATAVGYTGDGRLVTFTREPATLRVEADEVVLSGESVYDVGHELFYGDSGGGIACASCHAEGGDDGLVWSFDTIGQRRTQDIRGGILGSEPFHWDGDMADFRQLAAEVFSGRMAGPALPDQYADALVSYIDSVPVPAHGQHLDPLAVERGRAIFESAEAECTSCHSGPRLSRAGSFDVGTGGAFQIPSLIGVSLRAPFIHSGCADSLSERFEPGCGGDRHGNVSHLSDEQMADLIAYLESV